MHCPRIGDISVRVLRDCRINPHGQEILSLPEEGETETTDRNAKVIGWRRLPRPLERRRVV